MIVALAFAAALQESWPKDAMPIFWDGPAIGHLETYRPVLTVFSTKVLPADKQSWCGITQIFAGSTTYELHASDGVLTCKDGKVVIVKEKP